MFCFHCTEPRGLQSSDVLNLLLDFFVALRKPEAVVSSEF